MREILRGLRENLKHKIPTFGAVVYDESFYQRIDWLYHQKWQKGKNTEQKVDWTSFYVAACTYNDDPSYAYLYSIAEFLRLGHKKSSQVYSRTQRPGVDLKKKS